MANPLPWFETEEREGRMFVFDPLRRRFVALTPEEKVRQQMLCLLVEHLHVPAGLLAVEYSVKVNGLDKRADAVVFGAEGNPLMIVECKAPSVTLTEAVLEQAGEPVDVLMGWEVDSMKLKSSMTLFDAASPDDIFGEVLDTFFDGSRCLLTLRLL